MSEKLNAGFIGLGNIGKPMAKHLVCDALNAHVFDIFAPAVEELVELGATGCATVAELASQCVHIGICVRDDAQVESLLHGDDGILANAAPGSMIAIHSTVTQANLLDWAAEAADKGLSLIDAPITGGAAKAEEGILCYMVGGTEEELARVAQVIDTSAEKIVHAGALGAGIALKLCNNYIQYTEFVALAEAARLADACGLSLDVIHEVGMANGVVNSQMHQFVSGRNGLAPVCTEEQMEEIFSGHATLARKDMDCALSTAAEKGVVMPTAEFIRDRIENVFLARDESRPPAP
jgi:3-hydroxyisobutyrate dehydrogenase